jgi:hypothetical protein
MFAVPELKLPVTVTVYVPASALLLPELLDPDPPPHEVRVIVRQASNNTASAGAHRSCLDGRNNATAARSDIKAKTVVTRMTGVRFRWFTPPNGDTNPCDDVATDTVTIFAAVPLRTTELGDTEHVDIDGPPLQLSDTDCANPLVGAIASE